MKEAPEPVKVSPIIRLFRYSFLIAGIIYGATKLKTLQIIEEGRKEERERKKKEREDRLAEEKRAASEKDIQQIIAIFRGPSPNSSDVSPEEAYTTQQPKLKTEDLKHKKPGGNAGESKHKSGKVDVKYVSKEDRTGKQTGDLGVCPTAGAKQDDKSRPGNTDQCKIDAPQAPASDKRQTEQETREASGAKKTRSQEGTGKKLEQQGYIIESFKDKVPFAEAESFKEEFRRAEKK